MILDGRKMKFASRKRLNQQTKAEKQFSPAMPIHLSKKQMVGQKSFLTQIIEKINFSQVFAGQAVGIKEMQDDIWLVSFMDYDLGYFDLETRVLEPLENPFGPKVLPMSSVRCVTHVSGPDP